MNDRLYDVILKLEGISHLLSSAMPGESVRCDHVAALLGPPLAELIELKNNLKQE